MTRSRLPLFAVLLLALVAPRCLPAQGDPNSAAAKALLDASGLKGGFAVHLGAKDGSLAAGLGASAEALHVHGLVAEGADLGAARKAVQESGIYGRVSLDRLPPGGRLPYVDNMVNLIVADDANFMGIAPDEIQRALAPYGRAFYRDTKGDWKEHAAKPWPGTIDQWTHYLHDASGNAVAHDDEVGPPRHMQWLGSPRWSRHHDRMASMSALVSAKGKMFYIMDEGSRVSIQMPADWKLIARDGFNGVILWKRDIPQWQNHLWPLKSGPTHLARRLVAEGDRVYATLGMVAPVEALDALTGESVRTYAGSEGAEEIIKHGDLLFALVNRGAYELAEFAPLHNTGDQARVRKDFHWNEQARHIAAYDEATGEKRWELESKVAPLTLSANAERVYYHDGEKVVCLNRADGKQVWASEPATRRPALTFNFGPRLVVYKDTVLYAGGDRKMVALDAASGEKLWEGPHARSGYESPEDIIVSGGLVWVAPTTSGGDTGIYTGRDPRTGEVKSEFPPDVQTYWFHHRCYIAKATDKYLMPSRTGIEFVDYANKHWEIHHWVRGGCLYGVMPCNGLTYAPPHNCFCFPEAKLFGFNALAADSPTRRAPEMPAPNRLEKGPAFGAVIAAESGVADWPTYRADNQRSGAGKSDVPADAREKWTADLQGRLSAVTVAAGRVYVARVDAHEVVALDEQSGAVAWRFTAGGRVDSPPTIWNGRAYFGGADGWVYCLRAADGELIWRFRAAPEDRRLFAFEQLESVWPVHGSTLLEGGGVWFVAGRSYFLDGGIHLFKLDPLTGEVLLEKLFDDKNPETGNNLQEVTKTLQGPVGLPDILSCDGKFLYMRSQKFDFEGNRIDIAPVSGNSAEQGADQRGEGVHLFSPNGFLDSEWFHRAYWVYGKSFAGSHNGYYQAGKFTPGGRLLVHDGENVFGYGRKSQYLKWTTTIEHQLFSAPKEQPDIPKSAVGGPKQGAGYQKVAADPAAAGASVVTFGTGANVDPAGKPLTVEAWVRPESNDGAVVAHGGPQNGYAIYLQGGKPRFAVRSDNALGEIGADAALAAGWTHLAATVDLDRTMKLYVNGELAAEDKAPALLAENPKQPLDIGADSGSAVAEYESPFAYRGLIDEVRVYHAALTAAEIKARAEDPSADPGTAPAVASAFTGGKAESAVQGGAMGEAANTERVPGKLGDALKFAGMPNAGKGKGKGKANANANKKPGNAGKSSFQVEMNWAEDVPLFPQGMALAGDTIFIAGAPDLIDEEETFARITRRDESVDALLAQQDAALRGEQGSILMAVSKADSEEKGRLQLPTLPVWDGMAAANGKLFVAGKDGKVYCLGE